VMRAIPTDAKQTHGRSWFRMAIAQAERRGEHTGRRTQA